MIEEKSWTPIGRKHDWTEKSGGLFFELIIKDENGKKLDRMIWNTIRKFKEILELLRLKYGLDYRVNVSQPPSI